MTHPVLTLQPRCIPRCPDLMVDDVAAAVVDLARSRRNHGQLPDDAHDRVASWTSCHAAVALELLTLSVVTTTPDRHAPLTWVVKRVHALRQLWLELGGVRT